MELQFHCPKCNSLNLADEEQAGNWTPCSNCGIPLMIPLAPVGPGTKLGNYKILHKIGAGGMGDVYLAEQTTMQRKVALKVLPAALSKDRQFLTLFQNEIKNQGSFSHPNIATAFDAGIDRDMYYLAMEYVKGYSLGDFIDEKRNLPETATLKIALEVAKGLSHAWDKNKMIHRDIKPGNIMVDEDRSVKILDLGLARSLNKLAKAKESSKYIQGTPQYMAPEQLTDKGKIDFRADMYALGATMYHMLTGEPPFDGNDVLQIIKNRMKQTPEPIEMINSSISVSTIAIVEKLMAQEPDDRYETWHDAVRDLDKLLIVSSGIRIGNPLTPSSATPRDSAKPNTEVRRLIAKQNQKIGIYQISAAVLGLILLVALFVQLFKSPPQELPAKPTNVAASNTKNAQTIERALLAAERSQLEEHYLLAEQKITDEPQNLQQHLSTFIDIEKKAAELEYGKYELLSQEKINFLEQEMLKENKESLSELIETEKYGLAENIIDSTSTDELKKSMLLLLQELAETKARLNIQNTPVKTEEPKSIDITQQMEDAAHSLIKYKSALPFVLSTEQLSPALDILHSDSTRNILIAETFIIQTGQTIELPLKKDTVTVKVLKVTNASIHVEREINGIKIPSVIKPSMLSIHEQAHRLSLLDNERANFLQGMLALEIGATSVALNYFSKMTNPLGEKLVAELEAQSLQDSAHLESPHQEMGHILSVLDLSVNTPPEDLITEIRPKLLDADESQKKLIRFLASYFIRTHKENPDALIYKPLLSELSANL